MNLRTLTPIAAAAGLWLAGFAPAQEPARLPSTVKFSNQELANSVAAQLDKGGLRGYAINISCNDGVVELSGRVADSVQREQAIRTTLAVPGVKNVVDSLVAANFQHIRPVSAADPAVLPPPANGPIVDPLPVAQPLGAAPYDLNPPRLPPYAWPTYAPYNNFSRVAYPQAYPYNAWPFIGPFYPFPKVPLGWRSVTLEWQDGHWYFGRNGTKHDYWRIRYW